MTQRSAVKWPGKAYDETADDLGPPIQQLLVDLHVLEDESEAGKRTAFRTPFSLQVITAGATAMAKVWPVIITTLGTVGGWSLWRGLGYDSNDPVPAAAFTLAAGLFAAAVVIGIAVIVRADVSARATATAAQYHARAQVTSALLSSSQYNVPLPPQPPAPALNYMLMTKDDRWHPVTSFRATSHGVVVAHVIDQDEPIPMAEVCALVPTTVWNSSS